MTMMLLEWVFTSIFLILVVLALRAALGKRMSAGLRYALWAVVLVRLLVPVQLFTSPIAGTWVFTEARTEKQIDAPAGAVPSYSPGGDDVSPALGKQDGPTVVLNTFPGAPDAPAVPDAPEPPAAPDLTRAPAWLGWMWLAGSAAVALVLLASNLRFYRRLRGCRVPLDGADRPLRVYVAVGLPSPCLFGIFRPAVYVTPEAAADPDMLRHVLAHEYTHYRHGDHLWSLLRCAALAVHWWNPLVWLAAGLSQRDGELACDEGALKRLGDGERAAYGGTLLALVTAKPGPGDLFRCATTMAGDKKSLKERITLIAQAPKRWLWAAAVAVLVTALACVCAFGQAEPEDPEADFWPDGVSEITFIRDKGGFGGDFNIHLDKDGDFTYYAGLFSSYIGMGTWTREGDVICLADEGLKGSAGIQYFYFKIEDGGLVFQAENSAKFMYVDVADGDRFSPESGAVVKIDFPYAGNGLSDFVVPDGVLETARDFVARQFRERAPGGVMIPGRGEYNEETGRWDRVEEPEHAAQFDRARINRMEGPWQEIRKGVEIETWRINYEYHTTTPEMAEYLLVGGMYLTEDGWLCPTYPNCTYLFFEVEGEERHFLTGIVENTSGPGGFAEDKDHFYSVVDDILTERSGAGLPVLVETDVKGVPEDVLDAATADVAQKFEAFAPGGWLSSWGLSFNHETNKWEPVPLPKRIGFDGVRINKMQGPWTGTLWGKTEVEVWRINYEYHAITPEFAENILTGGMYLTEDGWLCPTYPNCTYLIFLLDEQGGRSFATSIMYNMGGPSETEEESAGFFSYFYPYVAQVLAGQRLVEPSGLAPDLNRNGVPEELRVSTFDGGMGRRLEVWENGRLLYEDEGYAAHAGWNAVFLYHDDDGDCLLTYNPTMYHGSAGYSYRLFTLNESGASTARYETLDFDINFQPWLHEKFDVNEIVDFMNKVNGLLSRSVQLINTDPELLDTFDRLGRLEDDLFWLNGWEPVYVRGDRTLPDELWAFKAAMESQWIDPWGLTVTAGAPTSTGLILNFIQGGQVDGELYGVPTGELMYGSRYWLERADGSGWSEVPLLDTVEILAWPLEAYPIPKDGRRSEEVDWSQVYGELAPGRYRIGKIVFDHQAPGDNDERTYYAEFEVR